MTNTNPKKEKTMELNKLSVSIISVLITLVLSFGGFTYKTGTYANEIKNIKEQQLVIKKDLKEDIETVIENKADKVVVEMMIKKLDENIKENKAQHKMILSKLDRIIQNGDK